MHGRALEDRQKNLGNVVGKDDEGQTPKESGQVRNGAEDAVEEEKGGVFEGGSADAVEHLHRYDGLRGVRAVGYSIPRSKDLVKVLEGKHVHTLAYAAGSLRRMTCFPAPRCTAGNGEGH